MRKNSVKNIRINGEVQKVLSEIIRSELKICKAYISVLADEEQAKDTIRGLKSAEGFIRTQLAKKINLRNTPEIFFVLDQSIEYGVRMSKLIDEVTKDLPDEDDKEENDNQ